MPAATNHDLQTFTNWYLSVLLKAETMPGECTRKNPLLPSPVARQDLLCTDLVLHDLELIDTTRSGAAVVALYCCTALQLIN